MSSWVGIVAPFLLEDGMPAHQQASILWTLSAMSRTNLVVQALVQCTDTNCGTFVLGTTSAGPVAQTTELPTSSVDLSILPADVDVARNCIASRCMDQVIRCYGDAVCNEIAAPFLVEQGMPAHRQASILWTLSVVARENLVVQALVQCTDTNCGTSVFGATSAQPVARTTQLPTSTNLRVTTSTSIKLEELGTTSVAAVVATKSSTAPTVVSTAPSNESDQSIPSSCQRGMPVVVVAVALLFIATLSPLPGVQV